MKRVLPLLLLALAACDNAPSAPRVSKDPVSVRGWVVDVEGSPNAPFRTVETEGARKTHLFQSTYVDVPNAPYVSGGIAENGAFLLLDVPPGNLSIVFTAPGAPSAKLELKNIPGNADLYLPGLLLKKDSVAFTEPQNVQVRMAAHTDKPHATGAYAMVGNLKVPVVDTPYAAMQDRHDYPNPPTILVPIAKVK
jgi:hypothetical protein